jgi:hypothetical protein
MANNFPYNLDEKFWTQHSDCNIYKIARLKVKDFLNNGKLESLNTLNNKYGAKISPATYLRLGTVFGTVTKKFSLTGKSTGLEQFFGSFKKGSKKCRQILNTGKIAQIIPVKEAFESKIVGLVIDPKTFSNGLALWSMFCLPNGLREFSFNFYHNRIKTNTRASHYTEITRWCTFCTIVGKGMGPFDDETFSHFFFECPTVKKIHETIESDLFEHGGYCPVKRWAGLDDNLFLRIFCMTIQYKIWEKKFRTVYRKPTIVSGRQFTFSTMF